jgi:hypothetical protein
VEALRELVEAMHEAFFGNDAGLPPQVIQAVNSAHLFLTVHPTPEAAAAMGAQGGPPSEAERLAFEAWMRGHSWPVAGVWDGTTYTGRPDLEPLWLDTAAMQTRMLWAAWRDRAALATPPPATREAGPLPKMPTLRSLLHPTYEPGDGSADGAQLVDGEWWHPIMGCDSLQEVVGNARAVLARWGGAALPAVPAVPVSERPWERPGWCDASGQCWCFAVGRNWRSGYSADRAWMLRQPEPGVYDTHSLPHWALPVPAADKGEVQGNG